MNLNDLVLFDRLEVIRNTINKYGEENFYISFSGGKDSTVLHYIIDEALPNNKIPRVYINTGIEYNDILKFVKQMQKSDNRIQIVNSNVHIPSMLKQKGYPFKSKEHAHKLSIYQNSGMTKAVDRYVKGLRLEDTLSKFSCPKSLLYQFTDDFELKVSEKCCDELKKKTVHRYEKQSRRTVAIIGLRTAEGGERANRKGCVVFDSSNNLKKFKPLNPVSNDFMEWYIESRNIKLCRLYYEPFNFKRTGWTNVMPCINYVNA
jgi:3'-phosphoadenosine 5'-phosphosulfate sulfotransferase (PAPS reductase)/FAD synthetase